MNSAKDFIMENETVPFQNSKHICWNVAPNRIAEWMERFAEQELKSINLDREIIDKIKNSRSDAECRRNFKVWIKKNLL